jgi:hypothetical protein
MRIAIEEVGVDGIGRIYTDDDPVVAVFNTIAPNEAAMNLVTHNEDDNLSDFDDDYNDDNEDDDDDDDDDGKEVKKVAPSKKVSKKGSDDDDEDDHHNEGEDDNTRRFFSEVTMILSTIYLLSNLTSSMVWCCWLGARNINTRSYP